MPQQNVTMNAQRTQVKSMIFCTWRHSSGTAAVGRLDWQVNFAARYTYPTTTSRFSVRFWVAISRWLVIAFCDDAEYNGSMPASPGSLSYDQ